MLQKAFTDNLLKVVPGLLVPLAQFVWKLLQEQKYEHRKAQIRREIAELNNQRDSLARIPASPSTQAALADLDSELAMALDQLANLAKIKRAAEVEKRDTRGFLANWFLFYAPSGFRAWCVHILFFVTLSITIFGAIGAASDWRGDSDDIGELVGLGVVALMAVGLRTLARKLDYKRRPPAEGEEPNHAADEVRETKAAAITVTSKPSRSLWASWFLLYTPSSIWAWCVHVLFFFIIAVIVFGGIGVALDWKNDPDSAYAFLGFGVIALAGLGVRAVARKLDRRALRPRARSASYGAPP